MKKILSLVAVLGLTAGIATSYAAAATAPQATQLADKPAKKAGVKGKVSKVDGTNVTIKSGKKGEEKDVTIATDANTKVTLADGKDGKVADLKEGDAITVTPETGTAATIVVAAPKPKK